MYVQYFLIHGSSQIDHVYFMYGCRHDAFYFFFLLLTSTPVCIKSQGVYDRCYYAGRGGNSFMGRVEGCLAAKHKAKAPNLS